MIDFDYYIFPIPGAPVGAFLFPVAASGSDSHDLFMRLDIIDCVLELEFTKLSAEID